MEAILLGVGPEIDATSLKKRNKLNVRDRVTKLLDPGSPFLELSQFAGYKLYENENVISGGIVTGVGLIQGKWVMVIANDPTIKAGSLFPITIKKHLRAQEIALENKLPCVYLVDSAGAYLPMQEQLFPQRDMGGKLFYYIAKMSARGITQISVTLGLSAGAGAYVSCNFSLIMIILIYLKRWLMRIS